MNIYKIHLKCIYKQMISFRQFTNRSYQYREALVITLVSEPGKKLIKAEKEDLEMSGRIASSQSSSSVSCGLETWSVAMAGHRRGIGVDRTTYDMRSRLPTAKVNWRLSDRTIAPDCTAVGTR